jgi:DNA/RNA-binding domain of Phe-tRNA-synthetase-like protein
MLPPVEFDVDLPDLLLGVVVARGVVPGPSPQRLRTELAAAVAAVEAAAEAPPPALKKAVRDLLRTRGYKPAGRGKPASEYLVGVARNGEFPTIDVLVDINNLGSLESGLPISVLDLGPFEGRPVVRFGEPGESYVFNGAGQEIDLSGLLLIADAVAPRGNPVKDSMVTKVNAHTSDVMAVIYGTRQAVGIEEMRAHADRFAARLCDHAGAAEVVVWVGP